MTYLEHHKKFMADIRAVLPEQPSYETYYSYSDLTEKDSAGIVRLKKDLPENFLTLEQTLTAPEVEHDADVRGVELQYQLTLGSVLRSTPLETLFVLDTELPKNYAWPLPGQGVRKLGNHFILQRGYRRHI